MWQQRGKSVFKISLAWSEVQGREGSRSTWVSGHKTRADHLQVTCSFSFSRGTSLEAVIPIPVKSCSSSPKLGYPYGASSPVFKFDFGSAGLYRVFYCCFKVCILVYKLLRVPVWKKHGLKIVKQTNILLLRYYCNVVAVFVGKANGGLLLLLCGFFML